MSEIQRQFPEEEMEVTIVPTVVFSIIFHIIVVIIIPLMITLFRKKPEFKRPETFQLVSVPTKLPKIEPKKEPIPEPVVEEKKPEPKKVEKKPEPKPEPKKVVSNKQPKEKKPKEKKPKQKAVEKTVEKNTEPLIDEDLFIDAKPKDQSARNSSAAEASYTQIIRNRIRKNWKPSNKDKALYALLKYVVGRNGSLLSVEIVKSSGNNLYDMQAERALKLAFPMDPFPKDLKVNKLVETYKFVPLEM